MQCIVQSAEVGNAQLPQPDLRRAAAAVLTRSSAACAMHTSASWCSAGTPLCKQVFLALQHRHSQFGAQLVDLAGRSDTADTQYD